MGEIKARVAYLQGLAQGINLSLHSAEGKLLIHIIDILADMAEEMNDIRMEQEDLKAYVESMDDDLVNLEEEVYDNERCDETCFRENDLAQEA